MISFRNFIPFSFLSLFIVSSNTSNSSATFIFSWVAFISSFILVISLNVASAFSSFKYNWFSYFFCNSPNCSFNFFELISFISNLGLLFSTTAGSSFTVTSCVVVTGSSTFFISSFVYGYCVHFLFFPIPHCSWLNAC